ncbi:MAG TPA: GH25 family lysozyme [Candidatus Cybelea sp.]|nr:GH25 family lysozyme [Candidatus Cybelea sp.]
MSNSGRKDGWDKFASVSSFLSSVLIAVIGLRFTYVYNQKQLEVQRASTLAQFLPSMGSSNPAVQQVAYQGLITLGFADLAARYENPASRAAFAVQSISAPPSSQIEPRLQTIAVRGIDVSEFQGRIDWSAVANSGIGFALMRATEGKSLRDGSFANNLLQARRAGIVTGSYHFYRVEDDAKAQAQWYLANAQPASDGFPPVVDIEQAIPQDRPGTAKDIQTWLDIVQKATGRRPMIYVYGAVRQHPDLLRIVQKYNVWLAQYSGAISSTPVLTPWTVWQYSSQGRVGGISGDVDLNIFNGNPSGLSAFVNNSR